MTRAIKFLAATLAMLVLVDVLGGQEVAKPDAIAIRKLVQQLASTDFKTRDLAARELSTLDDIPIVLRDAVKSADLETKRRAEAVIRVITERMEEKAFRAMVADLHKVEVDRFVRRMVTDEKFAGDKQWKIIETLAKAVAKKANDLGQTKYPVPDVDMKSLPVMRGGAVGVYGKRLLLNQYGGSITSISNSVVLCSGTMLRVTTISNSIIIADGDVVGATRIDNCLLIVSGKLGRFTGIRGSVILVNGEFGVRDGFGDPAALRGATSCRTSFIQAKNPKIAFTSCDDCVFVKMAPMPGRTSRILDTDKGPLHLLNFSKKKVIPDDRLNWGQAVNGLAVALAPADRKDTYLVRWKNVGNQPLEMRFSRYASDPIYWNHDDLRGHVSVKGADGSLLPARKPRFQPPNLGAPNRPHSVVLEVGKTHDEEIELAAYVEQPRTRGPFELSIELEVNNRPALGQKKALYWTGKVQSNVLNIKFGK